MMLTELLSSHFGINLEHQFHFSDQHVRIKKTNKQTNKQEFLVWKIKAKFYKSICTRQIYWFLVVRITSLVVLFHVGGLPVRDAEPRMRRVAQICMLCATKNISVLCSWFLSWYNVLHLVHWTCLCCPLCLWLHYSILSLNEMRQEWHWMLQTGLPYMWTCPSRCKMASCICPLGLTEPATWLVGHRGSVVVRDARKQEIMGSIPSCAEYALILCS